MKKRIIKGLLSLILFTIFITGQKVNAASASITSSKTSAIVGDKVTITITSKAGSWNLKVSGSGISDSIVGYDLDGNKTTTKTYTLNTSKVGTYTVSLKGDITDYDTEVNSTINKSVTVTVKSKPTTTTTTKPTTTKPTTTKPTTTTTTPKPEVIEPIKISKFDIIGYNIDFNNDKLEYEINVDKDVTKLYIIVEGNSITTSGDKIVDIKDKDEIIVKITKKTLSKEYKIKINRKKTEDELKEVITKEFEEAKRKEEESKKLEIKEETIENKSINIFLISTIILGIISIIEFIIIIKRKPKNL